MKTLTNNEIKKVNGGFPPAVVAFGIVAARHYGTKAMGAAISGFVSGYVGGWLRR